MHEVFEATRLTPRIVARESGYLDWDTQPSRFKHYPHFCFRYDREALGDLAWLLDLRRVTDIAHMGGMPYHRLNVPSAGNLHPVELYVQIRGIKGIISGIYHIDALEERLVLLREIERDGLETYVGMTQRFHGMLFLISLVPFRSYWKYGERSWRYCYLDAGHQYGALGEMLHYYGHTPTLLSQVERGELNRLMGFDAEEFGCAIVAVGEATLREAEPMRTPLMRVAPTDYSEGIGNLKTACSEVVSLGSEAIPFSECITIATLPQMLGERRSAREFLPVPLPQDAVECFMNILGNQHLLGVTAVMLRAEGYDNGIYRNGSVVGSGFFAERMAELLVSQRFISRAAMVVALHTAMPDAGAHFAAGAVAQECYMYAAQKGVGCSGIGAYYDSALQEFLRTDEAIVYLLAIGVNP